MDVEFACIERGKKLYTVRSFGQSLFTGTRGECERFQQVRLAKLRDERESDLRPHRSAPFAARTYRVSNLGA